MKSGYREIRLISQSTEKHAKILELENPSGTVPQHGTGFGSSAVSAQKLYFRKTTIISCTQLQFSQNHRHLKANSWEYNLGGLMKISHKTIGNKAQDYRLYT